MPFITLAQFFTENEEFQLTEEQQIQHSRRQSSASPTSRSQSSGKLNDGSKNCAGLENRAFVMAAWSAPMHSRNKEYNVRILFRKNLVIVQELELWDTLNRVSLRCSGGYKRPDFRPERQPDRPTRHGLTRRGCGCFDGLRAEAHKITLVPAKTGWIVKSGGKIVLPPLAYETNETAARKDRGRSTL